MTIQIRTHHDGVTDAGLPGGYSTNLNLAEHLVALVMLFGQPMRGDMTDDFETWNIEIQFTMNEDVRSIQLYRRSLTEYCYTAAYESIDDLILLKLIIEVFMMGHKARSGE